MTPPFPPLRGGCGAPHPSLGAPPLSGCRFVHTAFGGHPLLPMHCICFEFLCSPQLRSDPSEDLSAACCPKRRLCGRGARRRSGCGAPEWRRLWRRSWHTSPPWPALPRYYCTSAGNLEITLAGIACTLRAQCAPASMHLASTVCTCKHAPCKHNVHLQATQQARVNMLAPQDGVKHGPFGLHCFRLYGPTAVCSRVTVHYYSGGVWSLSEGYRLEHPLRHMLH